MTGSIPAALGSLSELRILLLNDTELSGSIPTALQGLVNLEHLLLDRNQLTGAIPSEFGSLSRLRELSLHDNQLDGSIPWQLGDLGSLQRLALGNNRLSGNIPATLGNLRNVEELYLNDNRLIGGIPAAFGGLTSVEHMWLYGNGLSGPIPEELGSMESLLHVRLDSDTGLCLPPEFPLNSPFGRAAQRNALGPIAVCEGGGPGLFTDDPIVAGATPIKAVHFTELRVRVDALRVTHGLGRFSWTDSTLTAGVAVRGIHVSELRTALGEVYDAARRTPAFSTAAIQAGSEIRARHINELRRAVEILGGGGGDNRSPEAVGSIPPQTLTAGGTAGSVDAGLYFRDPDGDALTYTARSASGVVAATVSGSTVTLTPLVAGTTTVTVTARDPGGLTATQSIGVTVSGDGDLMITSNGGGERATITMPENRTAVTTVTVGGGTPPYEFQWSTTETAPDGRLFIMNTATGALAFRAAPDYENPIDSDGDNNYVVNVYVLDASRPRQVGDSQIITVTITDEDESGN